MARVSVDRTQHGLEDISGTFDIYAGGLLLGMVPAHEHAAPQAAFQHLFGLVVVHADDLLELIFDEACGRGGLSASWMIPK